MKRVAIAVGFLLLWLSSSNLAQAQTSPATDDEQELVRRELEYQIGRDRNTRVTVELITAQSYFISNGEISIRGRGRALFDRYRSEDFRYDCLVDTRRGRVTKTDWSFGQRRSERDDYNSGGDSGRPSSDPLRNGRYEIELVATRRLLDGSRSGSVVQSSARGARSQQWDIEDAGNGYYYIRSASSGYLMVVSGNGRNGSPVVLAPRRRGGDDQSLWEIRSGPDNGYYFINRSGKALDSPSSARNDGGFIQVYDFNGEANQRFLLRSIGDSGRYDDRYPGPDFRPGGGRSGRLIWSGRVDDVVELAIRDRSVQVRVVSGQPVSNARSDFSAPLPRNDFNVQVEKRRGRGSVEVLEQPSRRNGYTAIIQIRDSQGGASDYEIEVSWN